MGQGLLVHRYTDELARHGVIAGQVLLTVDDVTRRSHYRNAYQTFAKLLELGVLPIVNENDTVATSEIRFGDNDRLAALVAHLVHADLLVLLSDVDGLYDGRPSDPASTLLTDVTSLGRPRRRTHRHSRRAPASAPAACRPRSQAAQIATGAGIPVVLTSADQRRGGARRRPRSARSSTPPASAPHAAAVAGARDRARRAPCCSTQVRSGRSSSAGPRCSPRASPARPAASSPATPSTSPAPTATRSPAGWSTSMPPRSRTWSAARSQDLKRDLGAAYEREVVHRDDLVLL